MNRPFVTVSLLLLLGFLIFGMESASASAPAPDTPGAVISATARAGDEAVPKFHGCVAEDVPALNAEYEQRVVELVNQERAGQGLPPLKRMDGYERAARYHAADMGQDDYFEHPTFDRDGEELIQQCDTWQRIANFAPGANAENAGGGHSTPEAVVQGWMVSEGHRANILNTYSREIGVGYYAGSGQYYFYWVLDLGRRDDVYPLIINGEAISTGYKTVSLFIYGDWQEMRLRNELGDWTNWKPFQSSSTWTLGGGIGEHTVTVELRNGEQTATSSDSILLLSEKTLEPLFLPMTKK